MSGHNESDGLHVQSLEQQADRSNLPIHVSEAYKPTQHNQDAKQVPSNMSSPYYTAPPHQSHYFTGQPGHDAQPPPLTPAQYEPKYEPQSKSRRNPWGLSPLAFATLIALITAIIVGGAVGGGVGAAVGNDKSSCPTTTTSGTSATGTSSSGSTAAPTGTFLDFIPPSPSQIPSLYTDCGSINGSLTTSTQGDSYRLSCPQAILGSSGSTGVTLSELVAYTLQDCIDACSLMNHWKESAVCNSVTWDSGMAGATAANFGGNCWLFDNSTNFMVKGNSTSARLQ